MSLGIRLPNITATTDRGQLEQIRSYLYQMAEQLNWALNNVEQSVTEASQKASDSSEKKNPAEQAQATFAQIKSLIIKSADIVEAYTEKISKRLEGVYVAQSDFGIYAQQTALTIEANSKEITNLFDSIELIDSDVEGINDSLRKTSAYIKTGEIDHDGEFPVYGIEIGQENEQDGEIVFNKYARFTSDKLSFYDQYGTEVAYVSDRKLFITTVEIGLSLIMGGFVDMVQADKSIVTKWVG